LRLVAPPADADTLQRSARRAAEWPQSLMRCGTMEEVAELQGHLYPEVMKSMFETSVAILGVVAQMAQNARTPLQNRAQANS
jgi:hypothetical protein